MLKSNFLLCEGVQNASFLNIKFLFCKGIQGDICFSWAVAKNNFYHMISTTHHSQDIHCILPCCSGTAGNKVYLVHFQRLPYSVYTVVQQYGLLVVL